MSGSNWGPAQKLDEPEVSAALEQRLAQYARRIEEQWHSLADGERLRLMTLCCTDCGAIAKRFHPVDEIVHNAGCPRSGR